MKTRPALSHWLCALVLSCLAVHSGASSPPGGDAPPNILIILVDDAGLMDFEPFGGEAHMPTITRLADEGMRFTGYRTSPLCAPSRAMLLTGIDNHRTGVATIPEILPAAHADAPGYSMSLEPGVRTLADRLLQAGYRTYMTGKWHLGDSAESLPPAHGFERSFALSASGADNWEQRPYMAYYDTAPWFEDGEPATLPEDFYSSAFLVDRMLAYLQADQSDPRRRDKPFLAYIAFQAIHIPVQAPREFTQRYVGRFDEGWQVLRRARWQRAQQLGLIPPGAPLAQMPAGSREWASLADSEREYYAKAMAVNAGMLEAMDFHIGRLLEHLEASGELDNTLVVVTSDNGPEHNDVLQTPGAGLWKALSGYHDDVETMGEKGSLVSIGPEWAAAAAAPGRQFKFYTSSGGIRVPLILRGPGIRPGTTTAALSLVTDITPTLLDYAGVAVQSGPRDVAITGRTLRPLISAEAAHVYAADEAVGMEVGGNAALFKGGYKLVRNLPPHGDGEWHLYHVAIDPGETADLANREPARLAAMLADYQRYAQRHGVLEMPEGFNWQRQLLLNTLSHMLANNTGKLVLGLGLLLLLGALLVRLRRRAA